MLGSHLFEDFKKVLIVRWSRRKLWFSKKKHLPLKPQSDAAVLDSSGTSVLSHPDGQS